LKMTTKSSEWYRPITYLKRRWCPFKS
jgi:hypothetical protein